MKTTATLLTEHFINYGVTHVFGIPGKAITPLVLEVDRQGVKYVLCRHEAGAGFAAAGFALARNSLGVAIGTSGPGGTNMLTAAGQAKACNLPVLFITGHPSVTNTGKALVQDSSIFGTDLVKMFEPVTLFSARVDRGDVFPLYFQHALEKACYGKKGPVHLSIPFEILREKIPVFSLELPTYAPVVSTEIEQIVILLKNAKSPVMLIGKGIHMAKAYEEVQLLSAKWNLPVITTPSGKGCFPTDNPLSLGGIGVGGSDTSMKYLEQGIDLMIVLGTKLPDISLAGLTPELFPQQIIHFDYEPTFIGKSIPIPTTAVLGDIKHNLQILLHFTEEAAIAKSSPSINHSSSYPESVASSKEYISAKQTMRILRKQLPRKAKIIADSGSHAFYAVRYLEVYEPGSFYLNDVFGAMGHAIGMSIGMKLANPVQPVVCITGDGCLMMHGTEISTAVCNQIPVIFVVMNNGRLDMVEKAMKYTMDRVVGAIFEAPLDAVQFARSLGATAFCCRTESELEAALILALTHTGPTVVEIMLEPDEIPPTLAR